MNSVVRLAEVTAGVELVGENSEEHCPVGAADNPGVNPEHLRMMEAMLFAAGEPLSENDLSGKRGLTDQSGAPMRLWQHVRRRPGPHCSHSAWPSLLSF